MVSKLSEYHLTLPRAFMARIIFGWLSIMLLYFWANNGLIHQWKEPPLIYPEADNLYWLLHILYIPQFIMRNMTAAIVFDILLLGSTLFAVQFHRFTPLIILNICCLWLFQICFSSAAGHHYVHFGFLLLPLPFISNNETKFFLLWNLIRYWIIFIMASAGLYKLYYGGFLYQGNMATILKIHNSHELSGWSKYVILYLIQHPGVAQILYQLATILQLSFLIGFFTKRFDLILACLFFSFHVFNYYLLNVALWENIIATAVFVPWVKLTPILEAKWALIRFPKTEQAKK